MEIKKQKRNLKEGINVGIIVKQEQHDALRYISYRERLSIPELIRSSIDELIKKVTEEYPIPRIFEPIPKDPRPEDLAPLSYDLD